MTAKTDTKPTTTTTTASRRLISVAISLVGGVLIAGRLHFKQWAHEIVQYRDGKENDALVLIVYETVFLLLRIFVGAYGSYAFSETQQSAPKCTTQHLTDRRYHTYISKNLQCSESAAISLPTTIEQRRHRREATLVF